MPFYRPDDLPLSLDSTTLSEHVKVLAAAE